MSKQNHTHRKVVPITVEIGHVVEGVVARVTHPKDGVLVSIPDNPMAFMPNPTLIGRNRDEKYARRATLIGEPGTPVQVLVTDRKDAGHDPANPTKQRLIVNEAKPHMASLEKARSEREAAHTASVRAAFDALEVNTVVAGKVVKLAKKDSTRTPGEKFTFGAYVDLGGVSGLLHNREMGKPVAEGETVNVLIMGKEWSEDRPRIALSTVKAEEAELESELRSYLTEGMRTTGRDVKSENVGGVNGFTMFIGEVSIPAFLPADNANVKSLTSLTSGARTARVIVTGQVFAGKYALVTREGL